MVLAACWVASAAGAQATQKHERAPKGQAAATKRPPAIEQITAHTYRVGSALVDTRDRSVNCPGEINMDDGAIEYLAVAPGGKTHESLLKIDVRPMHLQLALLMIDLEPKNVLTQQGDRRTPQGDAVELRVRWKDRDGQDHNVRAEDLVADARNAKAMPQHTWVFTGSRILRQGFEADLEKSLVAVWHDPAAILDNPLSGGGDNAYVVNSRACPRRGTHIELVIRAVGAATKAGSAKEGGEGRP